MKNLESLKNSLQTDKRVDLLNLADTLSKLKQAQQELHRLGNEYRTALNAGDTAGAGKLSKQIHDAAADVRDLKNEASSIRLDIAIDNAKIQETNIGLQQTKADAEAAAEAIRSIGSAIENVGGVFNTLGNISGAIGDFSMGIANSFSSMGQLFNNASVTDTLTRLATLGITKSFAGNLDSAMTRYDILNTFTPYMAAAGVDSATADRALQRVNDAILGVPIGLDEAAQRLRRYQMFLGDTEQATNLTIGVQNAILAGGASEQMKNQAYMQIDRLLSAGKLNTSRQWLSLIQGLGVSMTYVNKQMGTAGMTVNEFVAGLTSGEISTREFLNALMELGKGESDAAQGLRGLVDIYKSTLEAWRSNIRFAATRGQANIFSALDETLETYTGKGNTGYMKVYRDFMNNAYKGVASYIKDNPLITVNALNNFERLLEGVQKFSASDFATEVFNRLGQGVDILNAALEKIPAGKLEEFAAFATTLAGPIGAALAGSSGLGQLLGIFERFKNFDFTSLVNAIAREVERMAHTIEVLLNMLPDGLMTNLMAFGLVWGKPIATVLTSIGTALNSVGAAIKAIAGTTTLSGAFVEGGILGWVIKLAQSHPYITAAVAGITALAGAIGLLYGSYRTYKSDLSDTLGFSDFGKELDAINSSFDAIDRNMEQRLQSLEKVEQAAQEAQELRSKLLELDSATGENFNASALAETADRLSQVLPGVDVSIDSNTQHLTEQARAALEDADAFDQLIAKMREAATMEALQGAYADQATAEYNKLKADNAVTIAEQRRDEAKDALKAAQEKASGTSIGTQGADALFEKNAKSAAEANTALKLAEESLEKAKETAKDAGDNLEIVNKSVDELTAKHKTAYEAVNHTTDSLKEEADALKAVAEAEAEVARAGLAQTMGDLSQNASETFKGFDEWDSPKPWYNGGGGVLTKDTKNMEKEANFLNTAADDLESVRGYFEKWNELEFPEGVDSTNLKTNLMAYLDEMLGTDDPEVAAQKIHNILAAFEEGDMDTLINLAGNKGATTEALERFQEETGNWKDYLEESNDNVKGVGKTIEDLIKSAEELPDDVDGLKEQMEVYHQALRDLISLGDPSAIETGADGTALFDPLDDYQTGKLKVGDQISELVSAMTDAGNKLVDASAKLAEANATLAEAAQGAQEQSQTISDAMKTMQESTETAAEEVPANTTTMASGLNEQMESAASTSETCAQRVIKAVESIAPAISNQVEPVGSAASNLANALSNGLATVSSVAESAASAVASAADSIVAAVQQAAAAAQSLSSISVPSTSGGTSNGSVNGGSVVVEAATGGGVFRRIGTDTQPYMLTPGEWVMRKGAVDYFGSTLFDRINALDIDGVYNSLIKTLPGIRGGNNYYTKNNNAKVTQNIITNNPAYPMRRAWRFANAL